MRLNDLCSDPRFVFADVPCVRTDAGEITATVGRIGMHGIDEFLLQNKDNSFAFRITDTTMQRAVQDCLRRRMVGLVTLDSVAEGNDGRKMFCLRIVFFLRRETFGRFQVILSNKAKATLKKHGFDPTNYEKLASVFLFRDGVSEDFCFAFQSRNDFIKEPEEKAEKSQDKRSADDIVSSESDTESVIESEIDDDKQEEQNVEITESATDEANETKNSKYMRICGTDLALLVRVEGTGLDCRAIVYGVVSIKRFSANEFLGWQLAYGVLLFSDQQSFVANRVRQMLHATPNYVNIWNEYAKREGNFLLKRARAVGEISYLPQFNITTDGIELIIEDNGRGNINNLAVGDYVQARPDEPPYIADGTMDWTEYKAWKNQQIELLGQKNLPRYPAFEVRNKSAHSITLKQEDHDLPEGSKLYFSIYGDELQIDRRESARRRIENGTSASPTLGYILGSQGDVSLKGLGITAEKKANIPPLSNILRKKIFKNAPTPAQIKAIDIALNTPDIAIIQGPPGTGKTTVITAILERLNELSAKNHVQPGQILVSSLQHDAVHNIIDRVKINSLPTIKFGQRRSDDNLSMQEEINKWCREILSDLEKKHPQLKQTEREKEIFTIYNAYLQSPSRTKAMSFLKLARELTRNKDTLAEVERIYDDIATSKIMGNDDFLTKIYRLRTDENSFHDDGQANAMDLYNELEILYGGTLNHEQNENLSILRDFAMSENPSGEDFSKIEHLRRKLLSECIGAPPFEEDEVRADITEIYGCVKEELQRPEDAVENIIYDFYSTLRDNPYDVSQSVAAYSFVFAATAQQTEKAEIKRAKGVDKPMDENSHAEYDTVVVDEAARVNPGDLMIPLSQASRRIILVGDQRQLPHMYDEEIFQALREDGVLEDEGDVKTSMFEHLWNKAEELHKADGIERRVTLDAQYRMHPLLGNFVSDNFYKPYGEPFTSPLGTSFFEQSISASPVRWVHIPADRGLPERRKTGSLIRNCEGEYIVETLRNYFTDPTNENLSFGVISFYRAQTQAIKRQVEKFDPEKKIRIGTVDEFQGMEFDIMFLSVVRSRTDFSFVRIGKNKVAIDMDELERMPHDTNEDKANHQRYVEKIGSNIYGFLTDNRLCVALSRQKRLLIVVGDANMFGGEQSRRIAKVCVPSMYNLYELCRRENSLVTN